MIMTTLIANPPSYEAALKMRAMRPQRSKFNLTATVAAGVDCIFEPGKEDRFEVLVEFLNGGDVTGNYIADGIKLAELMVGWLEDDGHPELKKALASRLFKINSVRLAMVKALRKDGYEISRGTMLLLKNESA
jgi:hypothetical protein